jgi:hypothetical protein
MDSLALSETDHSLISFDHAFGGSSKFWHDGRVTMLETLVSKRIPYPIVAKKLGTTVGSVCGKVHRMGIGLGPQQPRIIKQRRTLPGGGAFEPDPEFAATMARMEAETAARLEAGDTVALADLENHHCRYSIGEPAHGRCCGYRRVPGSSYCDEHALRCAAPLEGK